MTTTHNVIEHFKDWPLFTTRDVRLWLKPQKGPPNYVKLLLHTLVKNKKIQSIGKGYYTMQDDAIVAGFAFQPFYYGLHYALTHYHLWTQATNPIIITTKNVRLGVREMMETNFVLRHISRKLFFGFETIQHYAYWIPVSTLEKTLIDFVYFRQKIPEEARQNLLQKVDTKKLNVLLKKSPKWVKKRIMKIMESTPKAR
jgi:predicted transcriptional regulator of viral defense system